MGIKSIEPECEIEVNSISCVKRIGNKILAHLKNGDYVFLQKDAKFGDLQKWIDIIQENKQDRIIAEKENTINE